MSRTIKCTNPGCGSLITVPEGSMQVICEHCNTWHFPSDESNGGDAYQPSPLEGGYTPPPASEDWVDINKDSSAAVPPPLPNDQNDPTFPELEPEDINSAPAPLPGSSPIIAYLATSTGVRLGLKVGTNVIGRKNADLIIEDKTVSRRHCVIEISENSHGNWDYFIYDIGHMEGKSSTNGVFVSGRSLRLQDYERILIYHESSFRIGKVNLVLQTN